MVYRARENRSDLAVFNALSGAVLKQFAVTFDYRKPGDAKKSPRRVRPYHLANRENLWYLVGFQNRVVVMVRWAFSFVTHGRGARLITGEAAEAGAAPREGAPPTGGPASTTLHPPPGGSR